MPQDMYVIWSKTYSKLELNIKVSVSLQDGATPLFKASHKGHSAVVGELLKYKPFLGQLSVSISCLFFCYYLAVITGFNKSLYVILLLLLNRFDIN